MTPGHTKWLTVFMLMVSFGALFFIYQKNSTGLEFTGDLSTDISVFSELPAQNLPNELERLADEEGALYAFDILRGISATNTPTTVQGLRLHTLGHVVSDKLYQQQGLEGVRHCTAEFSYSCFHSILSREILKRGDLEIKEIYEECGALTEVARDCPHGIGHGLVALNDYQDALIPLEKCAELTEPNSNGIDDCVTGVIMEFNMHTMWSPGGEEHRPLDERGLYYPCDSVRKEYINECYDFHPKWWFAMYGWDNYQKVGELCEVVTDSEGRAWCFRRIGFNLREDPNLAVGEMKNTCMTMPSDDGQAYCLQKMNEQYDQSGVCNKLDEDYKNICEAPLPPM